MRCHRGRRNRWLSCMRYKPLIITKSKIWMSKEDVIVVVLGIYWAIVKGIETEDGTREDKWADWLGE